MARKPGLRWLGVKFRNGRKVRRISADSYVEQSITVDCRRSMKPCLETNIYVSTLEEFTIFKTREIRFSRKLHR